MSGSIDVLSSRSCCHLSRFGASATGLVFLVATFLLDASIAPAQPGTVGPVGSSVNEPSSLKPGERVLVLRTGRVMKGRIKTISTGWLVSTDRGNAVIPFDQVHFDADDLNEAYLRLRIQNGRPTVASHLRLAEWCLSQNILAEAARELRDALQKDPANETARLMLNRVDNEISRRTPPPSETERSEDVVILAKREIEATNEEVRSLSGLSPDTAREFVATIQPLLLNKCGNARCHGAAARNEFRLTRLRSGAGNSRVVSERNLAAVLSDLKPAPDRQSRLPEIIRGSHAGRTVFNGRYGAVQMQTLQSWMQTAAKELNFDRQAMKKTAFSSQPSGSVSQRASDVDSRFEPLEEPRQVEFRSTGSAVSKPTIPGTEPLARATPGMPVRIDDQPSQGERNRESVSEASSSEASSAPLSSVQRLLQEARQHVRKKDAFDPEEFNRRFAGSRTQ